jgi:hypothetical protein
MTGKPLFPWESGRLDPLGPQPFLGDYEGLAAEGADCLFGFVRTNTGFSRWAKGRPCTAFATDRFISPHGAGSVSLPFAAKDNARVADRHQVHRAFWASRQSEESRPDRTRPLPPRECAFPPGPKWDLGYLGSPPRRDRFRRNHRSAPRPQQNSRSLRRRAPGNCRWAALGASRPPHRKGCCSARTVGGLNRGGAFDRRRPSTLWRGTQRALAGDAKALHVALDGASLLPCQETLG